MKKTHVLCGVICIGLMISLTVAAQPRLCWENETPGAICAEPITGMEFVYVPGDCFQMGCDESDVECSSDEKPRHNVCLQGFWIGKYEVTNAQWQTIMKHIPSNFQGANRPVEQVSWNDAQEFLKTLRSLGDFGGLTPRLPTEAEWEYACRAGSADIWCFGSDPAQLGQYAWFSENAGNQTHAVGQLQPNAWGLFDMHGNVWEWCQDAYISDVYATLHAQSPAVNPVYASGGSMRVIRGGSWYNFPARVRASGRNYGGPAHPYHDVGFRIVRTN